MIKETSEGYCFSVDEDKVNGLVLCFSKHEEENIIRWAMALFTCWVMDSRVYEIDYSDDPPWDSSGQRVESLLSYEACNEIMAGTLGEWMEEHYTGQTTATYMSGFGLSHDTYSTEIETYIRNQYYEVLRAQISDEDRWEELIERSDFEIFECDLEEKLIDKVKKINAGEAYRLSEKKIPV